MTEPITWTNCQLRLGDLKKWDDNPAVIGKDAAVRLVESFNEFGQVQALAVDPDNRLIDGHQRLDVWLSKYGADMLVDCRMSSRNLTQRERQKVAVYLRSAAVGKYNWDIVANWDADDLNDWGMDGKTLDDWKSDVRALENFITSNKPELAEDVEPQIDRAAELNEKWQVKTGDLWQIGEHRLLCGDSTVKADVDSVMQGEKADIVFTDPPYNVASESRNYAADKSKAMKDLSESEWDKDFDISTVFPVLESIMSKDCAVYMCTSHWLVQRIWEWMWSWSDFCFYCVWCKPNPMPSLSKRHWTWATELIPYAVRGKHISNFPQDGHALNWWDIAKEKTTAHPTEKALEVPTHAIEFSSNVHAILFDGFCGSGTTMVACENLFRKCRAIEISPNYCAVILERMNSAFPDLKIERITNTEH